MRTYALDTETLFRYGMYWRVTYGCARIVLALLLMNYIGSSATDAFSALFHHEMIEDPTDIGLRIASALLSLHPLSITTFLSAYLLFWGVIDVFLSAQILRKRMWAFPVGILAIGVFVLYELYRVVHTHSLMLWVVIVFDVAITTLMWREYSRLKHITPNAQKTE